MDRRVSLLVVIAVAVVSLTAMAPENGERHCAAFLVPTGAGSEPGAVATTEVDLGCYPTYAEAVAAGTSGGIVLPPDAAPATLTQSALDEGSPDVIDTVMIGTEYTATGYGGTSKSYFASETCSATVTWEVSYVTDAWNDDFESGKGFGGCDHNKKFHDSNFGGTSLTCTPNCTDYGTLANEVSSLRWKD
jgi:hypothetical protein